MVLNHEIKDNFLIEIFPFITRLNRRFGALANEYGTDKIIDLLIDKNRKGHIKSVTEFRLLAKLLRAADRGAPETSVEKVIRRVLDEPSYKIDSAYDSVRAIFDVNELEKRCHSLANDIIGFRPKGIHKQNLEALLNSIKDIREASSKAAKRIEREIHRG